MAEPTPVLVLETVIEGVTYLNITSSAAARTAAYRAAIADWPDDYLDDLDDTKENGNG